MQNLTIAGRVILPSGVVLSASKQIQVGCRTVVGSDRSPISQSTYPKMAYTRIYSASGQGIKQPSSLSGILSHVSFKDTQTSAQISTYLNALPLALATPSWMFADYDMLLEFHHEPEGDLAASAYTSQVMTLISAVATYNANRNALQPKVGVAQTFTGFAQRHLNKTMTDGVPATVANLWCGADFIGMDCEKDTTSWPTGYPPAGALTAIAVSASVQVGKPCLVPELGWVQQTSDTSGSVLAAWYPAEIAALQASNRCAAVGIYDTPEPPASTGNYLLTGTAVTNMAAVMAAQ